jgi:Lantibiotic biosynthesis dehydratase C-term
VEWRSVHVYYYDDDKDRLIVEAVRPLLRRIAPGVPAAYFVRHWRRGPHLRLNFRTDAPTFGGTVRPALTEIVGGYLARRPSTVVLDEQRLMPLHAILAGVEEDPGPRSPWLPDNSMHEAAYESRAQTVGGPEAAELLADFYVATNDIAFAMVEQVVRGGQRLGPCLDLMMATAHAFTRGGLASGFVSFRSHAEAFLAGSRDTRRRQAWDRGYAEGAAHLSARLDDVLAMFDGAVERAPLAHAWVTALRPLHRRAEELVSADAVSFNDPVLAPPGEDGSEFHRALLRGPAYTPQVRGSLGFRSYRLMLNYLYLHMTRHGVRPVDRFMLCHLAANTVEERLGVTALSLVSGQEVR